MIVCNTNQILFKSLLLQKLIIKIIKNSTRYARRFGAGRPIAPYLSLIVSTFYIRIVLFVPLIFLDSAVFPFSNLYYFS